MFLVGFDSARAMTPTPLPVSIFGSKRSVLMNFEENLLVAYLDPLDTAFNEGLNRNKEVKSSR